MPQPSQWEKAVVSQAETAGADMENAVGKVAVDRGS
jgi:hypothetical protein